MNRWFRTLSSMCFLGALGLSGFASLLHEVVWTRLIRLQIGSSTFTLTTVLAIFMGGLAIGSLLGGRSADRSKHPLFLFAWIELAIGCYCLLLPWLIQLSGPLFARAVSLSGDLAAGELFLRFFYSFVLLFPPATLMGATLPIAIRFHASLTKSTGASAGTTYAFNSLGAATGALAAGFLVIPNMGVWGSVFAGSSINFAAGAISLMIWKLSPAGVPTSIEGQDIDTANSHTSTNRVDEFAPSRTRWILLVGYGLTGFAAMTYEISWTRLLTLYVGSTVYAFAIILASFITGLAIGSLSASKLVGLLKDKHVALGMMQWAIALSALLTLPVLAELPYWMTSWLNSNRESFAFLQLIEWCIVFSIVLVPTALMGASFPIICHAYAGSIRQVGTQIGKLYFANNLGTIAGSMVTGFLLLSWLGIQNTLYTAVLLNVVVGIAFLATSTASMPRKSIALLVCAAILAGCFIATPRLSTTTLSFAPFVDSMLGDVTLTRQELKVASQDMKVIYYRDGVDASVCVRRTQDDTLQLLTNGRVEASSRGGQGQQILLAHLPLLAHGAPEQVLQIGLASGMTLSAAATHDVTQIDVAEITKEVIPATRYFDEYNRKILDDERVNVVVRDGRNYLRTTTTRYDAIISQPSDPAVAGVADLFTLEFFESCHDKLTDNGQLCVWLKARTIDPDAFKSVLKAMTSVFENTTLWSTTDNNEFMVLGSKSGTLWNLTKMQAQMDREQVRSDLDSIDITTIPELFTYMILGPEATRTYCEGSTANTDNNAILEFSAPRNIAKFIDVSPMIEEMASLPQTPFMDLWDSETQEKNYAQLESFEATISRNQKAMAHSARAKQLLVEEDFDSAIEEFRLANELNPKDRGVLSQLSELSRAASRFVDEKKPVEAIKACLVLAKIRPEDPLMHLNLAGLFRDIGDVPNAVKHYRVVAQLDPDNHVAQFNVAQFERRSGNDDEAIRRYREVLRVKPDLAEALNNLAWILVTKDKPEAPEAIQLAEHACDLTERSNASFLDTLSTAYEVDNQLEKAIEVAEEAIFAIDSDRERQDLPSLQNRIRLMRKALEATNTKESRTGTTTLPDN